MFSPRSVIQLLCACALWTGASACGTTPAPPDAPPAPRLSFDRPAAPALDRAAAFLCARETDGLIDDDARRAAGLYDGQVTALVRFDDDADRLRQDAAVLFDQLGITHVGTAAGQTLTGRPCLAVAGARRLVSLDTVLPVEVSENEAFPLGFSLIDATGPVSYVTRPDGTVQRRVLADDEKRVAHVVVSDGGPGRYRLEVLVDTAPGVPEVALYWPFFWGKDRPPPRPKVYFGDEGHDDVALSHRAEALVQRLRNELDVMPFKVHPRLVDAAHLRAAELSKHGALGHSLPFDETPEQTLARTTTSFWYARLSEVQAQAGTLEEAWHALLESPAHRYELTRTDMTHFGVWVTRGHDGVGHTLITVVAMMSRRPPKRDLESARTELIGKINLARHHRELPVLVLDPALQREADALVAAEPLVEATPAAAVAGRHLDDDTVVAQVLRISDPLRLTPGGAAVAAETTSMGVAMRRSTLDGQTRVVLLFSRRSPLTAPAPRPPG